MCMATCHDCGAHVDTDADPEAYVDLGNQRGLKREVCLCTSCREDRERFLADDAADVRRGDRQDRRAGIWP